MRLAYFSPLPPSKSGIADYSDELLPKLSESADITVFVDGEAAARSYSSNGRYEVRPASDFENLNSVSPFDLNIYHQGNNPHHEYIYDRALKTPSLLVLHEHCLHHLIAVKTLGRHDDESYWDEMFFAYGRSGAAMAEMRARDCGGDFQQFVYPLNRRIVGSSRGLIVHNQYAASQIEYLDAPGFNVPPIEIIPHHLSPKVYQLDNWDKAECRRELGIPENAWVVASFGFVTLSKRIPTLLSAFKQLLTILPHGLCYIVGEDHWKWSAAPLIQELGLKDKVKITGYTSEEKFFKYLKAVDVIVNLRYPTAGETSGTLIRSLGAGKPVIVSDHGQFGEIPANACLFVKPGVDEEKELFSRLRDLAYRPTLSQTMGAEAAKWARAECDLSKSASSYLDFARRLVDEAQASSRSVIAGFDLKFTEPESITFDHSEALEYVKGFFTNDPRALDYLNVHGQRILKTIELVPSGDGTSRLLELSSYVQMTPLIRRYGNYGEISVTNWWPEDISKKTQTIENEMTGEKMSFDMQNVDVERDRFPYPDAYFDVGLCCELIEHLVEDPMHMLLELNRVLKWGGLLILTTPNLASAFSIKEAMAGSSPYIYGSYNRTSRADRHSREYAPNDLKVAFKSAGFKLLKLFSEDLWQETDAAFLQSLDHTGVPRNLRGDNLFAVGRKMSTQFERYPESLYDDE